MVSIRLCLDGEVLQISRGLEEVEWWSIYKLANGEHLFDTYTPLLKFSISRETVAEAICGPGSAGGRYQGCSLEGTRMWSP